MARFRTRALIPMLLAAALPAAAQTNPFTRGFDAVPVKPSPLADEYLTLDGAELQPPGSVHTGVMFDLVLGAMGVQIGETRVGSLIGTRLDAHVMAAYTISHRFDVGLDVPLTIVQTNGFQQLTDLGFPQAAPAATALDDLRLVGRGLVVSQEDFPVGVAVELELRFPTGDGNAFTGGNGMLAGPRLIVERKLGALSLAANVGYMFRQTPAQYLNLYIDHSFTYGIGAKLAIGNVGQVHDLVAMAEVVGATATEQPFTFAHSDVFKSPAELFIGARGRVWGRWGVDVGVATGLTPPFAGGYGREFFRILIGFHYDVVNNDRDGDGVPDDVDRCPDQPGLPEHDGCPDRDGDDVPDIDDKCPDEAGPPENDGCPIRNAPMVAVEATRLRLRTNIRFETGSATIDRQSFGLLDEVTKVLKDFPQIELVRIEGHTDNRGTHAFNQDLSSRRANAVLKYLKDHGIASKRMEAAGHSFDNPIASNATPLGRAKNRRVEFRLIRVGGRLVEDEEKPKEAPAPAPMGPETVAPASPAPSAVPAPASPPAPERSAQSPDAGGVDAGVHLDAGSAAFDAGTPRPDASTRPPTAGHDAGGSKVLDAGVMSPADAGARPKP